MFLFKWILLSIPYLVRYIYFKCLVSSVLTFFFYLPLIVSLHLPFPLGWHPSMPMGCPSPAVLDVMSPIVCGGYGFSTAYHGSNDAAYKVVGEQELSPHGLNIHLLARRDKGTGILISFFSSLLGLLMVLFCKPSRRAPHA